MKKLSLIFTIIVALIPDLASAQSDLIASKSLGRLLNNVSCTALVGARTFTLPQAATLGYEISVFQLNHTHVSATDVRLTCQASQDNQTTWAALTACSVSAGLATCDDAVFKRDVATTENWVFRVDMAGTTDLKCVVTCTGAAAGDLVTVYGRMVTR